MGERVLKLTVAVVDNHATTRPSVTAMQQIGDWLQKLGLSEYAQRFVENGIGVAALPI